MTDAATPAPAPPRQHLFEHVPHPHIPKRVPGPRQMGGALNKVALVIADGLGSMYTFMLITLFITFWLILGNILTFDKMPWPLLLTLVNIPQLSIMIAIMVAQNQQAAHADARAEEDHKNITKSFHDIEQIINHLSAQDEELLKQTKMLTELVGPLARR